MASKTIIPTLNRYGVQMATPSPVLEEWISSYDNTHPLLDVGCAFGINTFEALKRGIPTMALDMEIGHLNCVQRDLTPQYKSLATCIFGSLPDNIPVSDNSVSGILVSEVLHFLKGNDVEKALAVLYQKLVVGGKLAITAWSDKILSYTVSKENQDLFYHRLSSGEKWPGIVKVDEEFLSIVAEHMNSDDIKSEIGKHLPDFLQVFSQKQMVDALEDVGFQIMIAKYARHPGYPDQDGMAQVDGINLQVVAEKKKSSSPKGGYL